MKKRSNDKFNYFFCIISSVFFIYLVFIYDYARYSEDSDFNNDLLLMMWPASFFLMAFFLIRRYWVGGGVIALTLLLTVLYFRLNLDDYVIRWGFENYKKENIEKFHNYQVEHYLNPERQNLIYYFRVKYTGGQTCRYIYYDSGRQISLPDYERSKSWFEAWAKLAIKNKTGLVFYNGTDNKKTYSPFSYINLGSDFFEISYFCEDMPP